MCASSGNLATAAVASQAVTESGTISGIRANGLRVYKGIPFAAPPLGVLVHVTLRRGRSVGTKQSFYKEAARLLRVCANVAPDNIMVVLTENELADWSFGQGEAQHLVNPPAGS